MSAPGADVRMRGWMAACVLAAACGGPPPAPDLAVQWPRAGAAVRPGEEVHFRLAVEPAGSYAFQLTAGGRAVGRAEGAGIATIPWHVPLEAVPGRRIDVTATARQAATGRIAHAATHLVVAATASAAATGVEEWHGTWTGRATGPLCDDEVWVFFEFTVAADGRLAGTGTGRRFATPLTRGGCTSVRAPAPTFDVQVGGRRDGRHLALHLAAPRDAFGMAAVHAAGRAPRVPVDSGQLTVETTDASGMTVRYVTSIARGRREARTARP